MALLGRKRSTRSAFLDYLLGAVADETRREIRAPRSRAAPQESRLPQREPTRLGGVRLGLRREGDSFTDFSGDAFRGDLTNDEASSNVQDVVARRLRALGIDPVAEADAVDPRAEAGAFARRMAWELRISGQHQPSGLSNQALLGIRASEGRDFAADTQQLRDHVRDAVANDIGAAWDDGRAASIASRAIVAWIVRRLDEQGLDVDLAPLNPEYRAAKIRAGLDGRIGVATGAWARAVRRAEAVVTA